MSNKSVVKVLTPWYGELPSWYNKFAQRISSNKLVTHEIVPIPDSKYLAILASVKSGVPCLKADLRSQCCDLRPLFGVMFDALLSGFPWWGWCDLDIITGDLDKLLAPLLDSQDVISWQYEYPYALNGGLSLFRNSPEVNKAYLSGTYKEVLATPQYLNWDEGGGPHDAPHTTGFITTLKQLGLRCYVGDQSWHEGHQMVEDIYPSRTCNLEGKSLIEYPTGRELALYHLGSKMWPLDVNGKWDRPIESYVDSTEWFNYCRKNGR